MSLRIVPDSLICREFGGLEPADPNWLRELDYWEDYNARFFRANGKTYQPGDSNVETWLTADDRAPYAAMTRELLDELSGRMDLSDIDLVLLAHWLPDIHLGTSVTNFALHHLGVQGGFGFAISDRGLTAPLFAMHCAARYLSADRRKALVLTMDQKHLLYRSPVVEALDPVNSAAAMVLEHDASQGMSYTGYRRMALADQDTPWEAVAEFCAAQGQVPEDVCLIAPPELLACAEHQGPSRAQSAQLLSTAPFAALKDAQASTSCNAYLLLTLERHAVSAVMIRSDEMRLVA
ncbi:MULTISPECIES: hypothetical protein [Phaeobacter]|uniref:Beta-ketoacyl synthase N-terminal domain-containing protein n=1 Tax=Phaeobacter piscinae TaxID=1580596 RepID=A0ABM6PCH9_9RHOB|nr:MULTISPECIES: hypothetical protein [Phaeobacter]ATG35440.1 hypothetical protein PhaeoP36_01289 [Phaeobacter piscinae]AUQ85960.1 hypothetical protein PhaeoP42_01289 [Phaeobacter piscinae]AUR23844.1 hypothetical protein PhaeoP23_01289 [Phaeobacter piscinae]KII17886.1 hypothetical protein OO25_02555 [Phaeobacter sp. S60]UTS80365.1 hypothetical protein OL67_001427 [Phaeobacter piscinae]